jgi:hypothetical protein
MSACLHLSVSLQQARADLLSSFFLQIRMEKGFDYLEKAFVDLFGMWDPQTQSFSRAFPHPPDIEGLYRGTGWLARLLNRSFDTLPPFFTENFNDVCPWNGTALFWCAARSITFW